MANVLSKVRVFDVIFSFMNDFNHGHLNPKKMEGGWLWQRRATTVAIRLSAGWMER